MTQQVNTMYESLSKVISKQIYIGQTLQIKNSAIEVNFEKNNVSSLNVSQVLGDSKIELPNYCELLSSSNCGSSIITQKVYIWHKSKNDDKKI